MNPAVGLCLGPYGGPRGGGLFFLRGTSVHGSGGTMMLREGNSTIGAIGALMNIVHQHNQPSGPVGSTLSQFEIRAFHFRTSFQVLYVLLRPT